jgi:hypothetical protein
LVVNTGGLAAQRVLVRVHTIVTGVCIEEIVGNGGNELTIIVGNTTSTQTGTIERSLASVRLPIAVSAARGGSGSGAGRRGRRG